MHVDMVKCTVLFKRHASRSDILKEIQMKIETTRMSHDLNCEFQLLYFTMNKIAIIYLKSIFLVHLFMKYLEKNSH